PEYGSEGMIVEELAMNTVMPSAAPFKASRFVVPPGGATDRDVHEVRECWFIASGHGMLEYDGMVVRVAPRDMLFLDSFKSHLVRNDGREPLVVFSIWWNA